MRRCFGIRTTLAALLLLGCGRIGYELTGDSNHALDGFGGGGAGGVNSANSSGGASGGAGSGGAGGMQSPLAGGAGAGQGGNGGLGSGTCVNPGTYPGGGFFKSDISDVSGMLLNGLAESLAGALRLVPSVQSAGSGYFTTPVSVDSMTSVYAHFSLQIGGGLGAQGGDGLAFVMQTAGPTALGHDGGGLGYHTIGPSIAIQFDTFKNLDQLDPDDNHVALTTNGAITHVAHVTAPFDINDGVRRYVWISFDGSLDLVEVFVSETPTRPSLPLLSHGNFDLSTVLGAVTYVGFAAGTGELTNHHDLLGEAWIATSTYGACR